MYCEFHPEEEAIGVCVKCHKPLCENCITKVNSRNFCDECTNKSGQNSDIVFKELEKLPKDVFIAVSRAEDYLKEKGVHKEVKRLKTKSSEILKSVSKNKSDKDMIRHNREVKTVEMGSKNSLDEIKKAKELLDLGAITEEEFREIKKKCLNKF